jgi:hypothetical protein
VLDANLEASSAVVLQTVDVVSIAHHRHLACLLVGLLTLRGFAVVVAVAIAVAAPIVFAAVEKDCLFLSHTCICRENEQRVHLAVSVSLHICLLAFYTITSALPPFIYMPPSRAPLSTWNGTPSAPDNKYFVLSDDSFEPSTPSSTEADGPALESALQAFLEWPSFDWQSPPRKISHSMDNSMDEIESMSFESRSPEATCESSPCHSLTLQVWDLDDSPGVLRRRRSQQIHLPVMPSPHVTTRPKKDHHVSFESPPRRRSQRHSPARTPPTSTPPSVRSTRSLQPMHLTRISERSDSLVHWPVECKRLQHENGQLRKRLEQVYQDRIGPFRDAFEEVSGACCVYTNSSGCASAYVYGYSHEMLFAEAIPA